MKSVQRYSKFLIFGAALWTTISFANNTGLTGQTQVLSDAPEQLKLEMVGEPAQVIYERIVGTSAVTWRQGEWTLVRSKTFMCGERVETEGGPTSYAYRCVYFVDSAGDVSDIPNVSTAALIGVW